MNTILHIIHADLNETERHRNATEIRKQSFLNQCHEQSIRFLVIPGVTSESTAFHNINLSHKKAIQLAKDTQQENIIIAEDDIVFTAPGAWKYFLSQIPEDYDMFMGVVYAGVVEDDRVLTPFSGGMTLYCIHERFYDFVLNIPVNKHLDRTIGETGYEKQLLVCQPMVCKQLGGYSFNLHRDAEYSAYEFGKSFFKAENPSL